VNKQLYTAVADFTNYSASRLELGEHGVADGADLVMSRQLLLASATFLPSML
jgi:hypothetical protein